MTPAQIAPAGAGIEGRAGHVAVTWLRHDGLSMAAGFQAVVTFGRPVTIAPAMGTEKCNISSQANLSDLRFLAARRNYWHYLMQALCSCKAESNRMLPDP